MNKYNIELSGSFPEWLTQIRKIALPTSTDEHFIKVIVEGNIMEYMNMLHERQSIEEVEH